MVKMRLYHHSIAFLLPVSDRAFRSHRLDAVSSPESVPFSLPSHLIGSSSSASETAFSEQGSTAQAVFGAVPPDPTLLIGMGSVVLLCVVAGFVWANDVVPISRTKLAISKSRGDVREYLDKLIGNSTSSSSDIEFNATMIAESSEQQSDENKNKLIKPNVGDGRDFERWLFSDWLNNSKSKGGRQKESALPILKKAKWNSGDNPIIVTTAIMLLGVVVASVTERIAS